jgi:hypothetical protein
MQYDNENNTDPLEHINYYNGLRLTEELLRKEQEYHIRLRRLLSKNLFTAGVADGLEVLPVKEEDSNEIKFELKPGLAIDGHGQAIVLLETETLEKIEGRFLTIKYDETEYRQRSDGCLVATESEPMSTSWQGPTLIRLTPKIDFRNSIPNNDDMELVLAEFEFEEQGGTCKAVGVKSGPRRFATARQMAGIHTFALEGEKDIDQYNPKRIYFHIRGRTPTKVVLYLRVAEFSSLYYTEMGQHIHKVTGNTAGAGQVDGHVHNMDHRHNLTGKASPYRDPFALPVFGGDGGIGNYSYRNDAWALIQGGYTSPPPYHKPLRAEDLPQNVSWPNDVERTNKIREDHSAPLDDQAFYIRVHPNLTRNLAHNWLEGEDVLFGEPSPEGSGHEAHFEEPTTVALENVDIHIQGPLKPDGSNESKITTGDVISSTPGHSHPFDTPSDPTGVDRDSDEEVLGLDTPITGTLAPLTNFITGLYVRLFYPKDEGDWGIEDVTDKIRDQLNVTKPDIWGMAGEGLPYEALKEGADEIRLDLMDSVESIVRTKGVRYIELSLLSTKEDGSIEKPDPDKREGGKIYYNLYVEAE